jgi:hypothetical protein
VTIAREPGFMAALNRLAKWRGHFAGWQLGTRPKGDPECDAVRDHREVTILLRAEQSAMAGLLLRKGVITETEWRTALEREANDLARDYSAKWPVVGRGDAGLAYDLARIKRAGWMKGWKS